MLVPFRLKSVLQSVAAVVRRRSAARRVMPAIICLWLAVPAFAEPVDRAPGCEAIAAAQARLATRLIAAIAAGGKPDDGAVVVSPASLAGAFDSLAHGADPGLRAAFLETLGFSPGEEIDRQFTCLRSARIALAQNADGVVQSADRVIFSQTGAPDAAIREALSAAGIEIGTDDLSRADAVAQVNDWVKNKTAGMIRAILDGPIAQPGLVALNALHFKAPWTFRFAKQETRQRPFRPLVGKSVPAMMMHLPEGRYAFRQQGDLIGIDLPFQSERFAMTIVTTRATPAPARRFTEIADWLNAADFTEQRGDLILPRLALSAGRDLLPVLDGMGLSPARLSPAALSGFGSALTLSRIAQRVEIRADEDGAEAAAATAATATRSFEGKPIHLVVDKPFAFAIRDKITGLMLAAGYVSRLSDTH